MSTGECFVIFDPSVPRDTSGIQCAALHALSQERCYKDRGRRGGRAGAVLFFCEPQKRKETKREKVLEQLEEDGGVYEEQDVTFYPFGHISRLLSCKLYANIWSLAVKSNRN